MTRAEGVVLRHRNARRSPNPYYLSIGAKPWASKPPVCTRVRSMRAELVLHSPAICPC